MSTTGTTYPLRTLFALAVASALAQAGCGSPSEPEKNIKPGVNLSAESEAKLKEMQASAKPVKRVEKEEPSPKAAGPGAKKGAKKATGPGAPKGLIPMRK
ncbi:MAG: hypothetical protein P4L84_27925 [Isosphaeraceae bacterium]|nr:hypothetical protein [Isosphaeraceae bacterium]